MIAEARRTVRGRGGRGADGGQSLVETAVVLPLLLVLLIGIVMFANAWRTSQTVTNATREGARFGVVQSGATLSESGIRQRVQDFLNDSGLDGSEATVDVTCGGASIGGSEPCSTGEILAVTTTYPVSLGPFDDVIGLIGGGASDGITLSSTTKMRKE